MTMKTEKQLWGTLASAVDHLGDALFTRIETSTQDGVADVEYVLGRWHGWLELKVCLNQRDTSLLTFTHPLTHAQYLWLEAHHKPQHHLRSWVLVGLGGLNRWRRFLVLPPRTVLPLLRPGADVTINDMMRTRTVVVAQNIAQVLLTLSAIHTEEHT